MNLIKRDKNMSSFLESPAEIAALLPVMTHWKYFATLAEQDESKHEPHEKVFDADEHSDDEDEDSDIQDKVVNEASRDSMDWDFREQQTCLDSTYEIPVMRANPLNIAEKSLRNTILSCIDGLTVKHVADILGKHGTKLVEGCTYRVS
ncbi:uncharacterized protein Z519_00370 [Cladophialophora bantiana CBS 173.52]|uniref:Uncharacterized protein n=1 Tax=Cladophialophora bantiana (strain ATCC 10958 / CBS 173.52 / CDC B-1940 / NIH 8579) TaxID=1442370 RepID=A0A0D2IPI0_CLAB1|nr:uncharacterized protein Z519_00370 [Cladophialophora bantiana CBS 173.52]KIW98709.1 hypothetical protein Z519_00370 [Cladophialophora bantiana CBS 173.52]